MKGSKRKLFILPMNALIMDRDALVREKITMALGNLSKEISVTECYCSLHAKHVLTTQSVDFMFLDLEFTDLEHVSAAFLGECDVIGMANDSSLALKAFELSVTDFLLKPIEETKLSASLDRLTARTKVRLSGNLAAPVKTRVALYEMNEMLFTKVCDILYCKAEGFYTRFFLVNNKQILVSKNLRFYEELLPSDQFFRSHKSFLINMNAVNKYVKRDGGYLVMENGDQVPISVRRKEELLRALMECQFYGSYPD